MICRVLPEFVANNYDEFLLVPKPKYTLKTMEEYAKIMKKRIQEHANDKFL